MFNKLINTLFSPFKDKKDPNFLYFEETKNAKEEDQEDAVSDFQDLLTAKANNLILIEEILQKEFYNYLFGQSPPTNQHDELSLYISNEIDNVLMNPKSVLDSLPVLPVSLTSIIEQLNNKEFDVEGLLQLIEQDAVIAVKVIELANSSYYNRQNKEITALKSAFMLLGSNGLMEGVINGFVSKLAPKSNIYFKQYGEKIWKHSLSTGQIARDIINMSPFQTESAQGYLIGLLCNLGDMVIYQLMIETFNFVHPDCQPNSFAFKEVMFKNSKKLAYYCAKYWNLPTPILDCLMLQVKIKKSSMLSNIYNKRPIACYIYEANIISELITMYESRAIDEETLIEAKDFVIFSDEAKQYIDKVLCENK